MRWLGTFLCVLFLCAAATPAGTADPSFPERGRSAVVDAAGVVPDAAEAALDARIVAWNRATGHQFAVATVPSLGGHEVEDYANRLLRAWGLGRAGADDGALLLFAPNERKIRIEVGYGLEGVLTDALSHEIIAETIGPALRRGDIAGALTAGADRIMAVAQSETAPPPPLADKPFPWLKTLLILAGTGFLLLFLWPLFETWFSIWPFYVLFPGRAERARAAYDARIFRAAKPASMPKPLKRRANDLSNMNEVYARMAERGSRRRRGGRGRHGQFGLGRERCAGSAARARRAIL